MPSHEGYYLTQNSNIHSIKEMFKLASITKRGKDWQAKVYYYDHDHVRHAKSKK